MYIDTYRYTYLHILTHTLYHPHSPQIHPSTAPPLHLINPQTHVKISTRARCTKEALVQHKKARETSTHALGYGVALVSRLLKIVGPFCKRAL